MKKNWDEEEEKLGKARKRRADKKKKMKVSGKNVFTLKKEMKKK